MCALHVSERPQRSQVRQFDALTLHHPPNLFFILLLRLAQGVTNFAVFSSAATAVSLVLFSESDLEAGRPTNEVPLDPRHNRSGDTWHIALPDLDSSLLYGRCCNPVERK